MVLLVGIILRLSFPSDIEYKWDEQLMFYTGQNVGVTEPWPSLGTFSSAGVTNPPLGVWVYVILTRISHATTPPELARAVQWMNIIALFVLAFFSLCILPEAERLTWCWATAFAAVSPLAVVFQRKIWQPCTLPLFCMVFWIAWHYRNKRTGAFFWGLIGMCLGQIHLTGFMMAIVVFLWTVYQDRRVAQWGFWLAGSLIGVIPMISWIQYLFIQHESHFNCFNWLSLFGFLYPRYWIFWVSDALGLGLAHSLKTIHYMDMLRYPLIEGRATYLCALAHMAIVVCSILIVIFLKKNDVFSRWFQDKTETRMMMNFTLVGTGVIMSLMVLSIYRHYLIITFPLEWVWLSHLGLADKRLGRRYLTIIWIAQLVISISFLFYIHINHGDSLSDYGIPYEFQTH